eukprot:TRINITY_DN7580_c0_g1_i1.p1 TRINITY_DN7580_c0_g1~~TRINITY_DN7580_c0_g1_i1.p1  ORF type:complete len:951 (-),score=195.32 TRINITY_DN7580_c0_g1_i1:126-2978(-)
MLNNHANRNPSLLFVTSEDDFHHPSQAFFFAPDLSSRPSSTQTRISKSSFLRDAPRYVSERIDKEESFRNLPLGWLHNESEIEFWASPQQVLLLRQYFVYWFIYQFVMIGIDPSHSDFSRVVSLGFIVLSCIIFAFGWNARNRKKRMLWIFAAQIILQIAFSTWSGVVSYQISNETFWEGSFLQYFGTMLLLGAIPMSYQVVSILLLIPQVIVQNILHSSTVAIAVNNITVIFLYLFTTIQTLRNTEFTRKQDFLCEKDLKLKDMTLIAGHLKNEVLISNVLPDSVVQKLRKRRVLNQFEKSENAPVIAEHFKIATIIYADIVGFSSICERHSPESIVDILNEIFASFDQLCERYKVEKLKTVGNAYIAVCGLPNVDKNHARAAVELALDMIKEPYLTGNILGEKFKLRIGIASGSVMAGVMGIHRWTYDVYGPPMREAEELQLSCEPGKVLISLTTYQSLEQKESFNFEGGHSCHGSDRFYISRKREFDFEEEDILVSFAVPNTKKWTNDTRIFPTLDLDKEDYQTLEDIQFKQDMTINMWTSEFRTQNTKKLFWEWKKQRLPEQMRIHLIVGSIILLCLMVEDIVFSNRKSFIMACVVYPFTLLATCVGLFLGRLAMRSELTLRMVSTFYYAIFIISCWTPFLSSHPITLIPRIELFTVWITSSPSLDLFSSGFLAFFQYFGGIAELYMVKITDELLKPSFHSPLFMRVPLVLLVVKYWMLLWEKKFFISLQAAEMKNNQITELEKRSNILLLNVLPQNIIDNLKSSQNFIAKYHQEISCMFVRIHGLEEQSLKDVSSILHGIFTSWDKMTTSFSLEKIKTIGFDYMVVGGLDSQSLHLSNLIALAFLIRRSTEELSATYSVPIQVSIGISMGPCVGGVAGRKRFCYDLWGETINIAFRLRSMCEPGKMQVDGKVAKELGEDFELERRGTIQMREKREVETFRVIREL